MGAVQEMLDEVLFEAEERVPAKLQEEIDNFETLAEEAIELVEEVDSDYAHLLEELYKLDDTEEEYDGGEEEDHYPNYDPL